MQKLLFSTKADVHICTGHGVLHAETVQSDLDKTFVQFKTSLKSEKGG